MTLIASGVTFRMPDATLRKVATGIDSAIAKIDAAPPTLSSTGSTSIN